MKNFTKRPCRVPSQSHGRMLSARCKSRLQTIPTRNDTRAANANKISRTKRPNRPLMDGFRSISPTFYPMPRKPAKNQFLNKNKQNQKIKIRKIIHKPARTANLFVQK